MDENLKRWRKEGRHLPDFLKDFHDQKDVFKAMHEMVRWEESSIGGNITWVEGQCYAIDCFLWFMARHGYTLQKSRAQQNFEDLDVNVRACRDRRDAAFASAIGLVSAPQKENSTVGAVGKSDFGDQP